MPLLRRRIIGGIVKYLSYYAQLSRWIWNMAELWHHFYSHENARKGKKKKGGMKRQVSDGICLVTTTGLTLTPLDRVKVAGDHHLVAPPRATMWPLAISHDKQHGLRLSTFVSAHTDSWSLSRYLAQNPSTWLCQRTWGNKAHGREYIRYRDAHVMTTKNTKESANSRRTQ